MRWLLAGIVAALLTGSPSGSTACRFWGLVGDGYPGGMITEQLRDGDPVNLRDLSHTNRDGWGIAFVHPDVDPHPLAGPVIRRGGSPAEHPSVAEYGAAVDELELLHPRVALAHVRKCTVSHCGVPDPHPFWREGVLFAHNGRVSDSLMIALLTYDDPDYLLDHPPDYDSTYIDSELYLLYLLKYHARHPEQSRAEALRHAVYDLAMLTPTRLNFVLVAGDTLFVLRCAPDDDLDPVRIYPGLSASPYWVAASQPLGSTAGWVTMPPRTLAMLVPGQTPRLLAITADPVSEAADPSADITIGRASPNPSSGPITIPLAAGEAGRLVSIDMIDAAGRLVWSGPPIVSASGPSHVAWDGRDPDGRPVPAGSYWCRIQVGSVRREQRIVIVR
jgi:predicted glutamine amidotransferase